MITWKHREIVKSTSSDGNTQQQQRNKEENETKKQIELNAIEQ